MKKHVSILVSGKVQGVFFRASTKEIADQLGIKGFVKNEPHGEVYIEAEADEEELKRFAAWCHRGPARARVTSVEVAEGELKGFTNFEIAK
jgi:acylphosphatase